MDLCEDGNIIEWARDYLAHSGPDEQANRVVRLLLWQNVACMGVFMSDPSYCPSVYRGEEGYGPPAEILCYRVRDVER